MRTIGKKMQKIYGFFIACLTFASLATAQQGLLGNSEMRRVSTYGNCATYDEVDLLSDETLYVMRCQEESVDTFETYSAYFYVNSQGAGILIMQFDLMFHLEEAIEVSVRVDSGQVYTALWEYDVSEGLAFVVDEALFSTLLNEVANGSRLIVSMGNEAAVITLNGSAEAYQDFMSRISYLR